MSSYDQYRGRRGALNSNRRFEGDGDGDGNRDREIIRKRQFYDRGSRPPNSSQFPKRGRGRCDRGRGGRKVREEFPDAHITRPNYYESKQGNKVNGDESVRLCANYFKVHSMNNENQVSVAMCFVKINPHTENKRERSLLIGKHKEVLGTYVYDGASAIYLPKTYQEKALYTFESEGRDHVMYQITIEEKKEFKETDSMFLTVLNLIIRQAMISLNFTLMGRNYFDASKAITMEQEKISIWPGFVTSVRQHEKNLLMCCDIVHKFMRHETVDSIIRECNSRGGDFKTEVKRKVLGITVLTIYNNRTYKICDVDWNLNPNSLFDFGDTKKSLVDYYNQRYQIRIKNPKQPLLVFKPSAKDIRGGAKKYSYLVPELCRVTGITDTMRNDFQLMRNIANRTRKTPVERAKILLNFAKSLQQKPEGANVFEENKLSIGKELVEFDARRLRQNRIYFGNDVEVDMHQVDSDLKTKVDWTKYIQDKKLFDAKTIENWAFIYPLQKDGDGTITAFFERFAKIGEKIGMKINKKACLKEGISDESTRGYLEKLDELLRKDLKFIMVILSTNRKDLYSSIKRFTLCTESNFRPTPLQAVVLRTLKNRSADSVAQKIAIQVNCKLGGTPWYINIPATSMMIIGFDVSHDTKDKRKSFGALVAHSFHKRQSIKDKDVGKYFSLVNHHENGQDISTRFSMNVIMAVNWHIKNYNELPHRIIIYRNGVGDGDIEQVLKLEKDETVSKLNRLYEEYGMDEANIGFIIINKKINTRILTCPRNSRETYDNPLPGTVIDDVITLPERYDFYLISQHVSQGTVSPTSYNIIYDELKMDAGIIQRLTYKLCHMYYNWSGTTRVPSVVQYAKKLAFLSAQFLHQAPNHNAFKDDEYLYFL